MAESGKRLTRVMEMVKAHAKEGVSLYTLNQLAFELIRADLASEIYFNGGVDGRNPRVSLDHGRIIHIAYIKLDYRRIVVDIFIKFLCPHQKTRNSLAWMDGLARIIHGSRLNQLQHTVGPHFSMDAKMAVTGERFHDRIRDRAYPHLQGGAVFHKCRRIFSDSALLGC